MKPEKIDLGQQPESRTLNEWASVLCDAAPGTIPDQWNAALVRSCQRGSLGFFTTSDAPRTPRITTAEIDGWLKHRFVAADLALPLGEPPRLKAPASFRQPASPAEGRHGSRQTIGLRR